MIPAIIIFYLFSGVNAQIKTYQHQVYMARKTRSNSRPIETGYTYSKINDGLGVISMYKNNVAQTITSTSTEKLPEETTFNIPSSTKNTLNIPTVNNGTYNNAVAKNMSPPKDESIKNSSATLDASPTTLDEIVMSYGRHDFRSDDDDLRKDSNMYDGWPYFHRSPYDYEYIKHDNEGDKAKDKRFIYDIIERVIPVREDIKNDIPPTYYNSVTERHESDTGSDNPMYGNQPFFSSILTDYFEHNDEEDPLTFKDLNWGKDFDNQRSYSDIDEQNKRVRRLHSDDRTWRPPRNKYNTLNDKYNTDEKSAVTEKAYNKYNNKGSRSSGDKFKEDYRNGYKYNGDNYRGFKDFVDSFVNKFGSEGHNKDANYKVNRTQDKGEKKKGFRRVYHKDEYQEDNEFYDNSNNKSVLTENGGSKYNIGGSEAILGSHAAAAIGNEANSLNRVGQNERQKYFNRNQDTNDVNGHVVDVHRYKDIAKLAAKQNNADYFNPYLE